MLVIKREFPLINSLAKWGTDKTERFVSTIYILSDLQCSFVALSGHIIPTALTACSSSNSLSLVLSFKFFKKKESYSVNFNNEDAKQCLIIRVNKDEIDVHYVQVSGHLSI